MTVSLKTVVLTLLLPGEPFKCGQNNEKLKMNSLGAKRRSMHFMRRLVAISAECDEILFAVAAQATSELDVVDLKILGGPTHLTSPAIPP
jgi:hypothetical protein